MDWPVHEVGLDVHVRAIRPMPLLDPALDAAVARHWHDAQRQHALFNGQVFSADRIAPGLIEGHWTEYRRVVAQMREPALRAVLGVRNLAVCGVLLGPDGVVLGRRNGASVYQAGQWQLPPAGSVDGHAATADGADLRQALLAELREELGLEPDAAERIVPLCIVEHPDSGVLDLGLLIETRLSGADITAAHAARGNAEYDRLLILPPGHAAATISAMGGSLVPSAPVFLDRARRIAALGVGATS